MLDETSTGLLTKPDEAKRETNVTGLFDLNKIEEDFMKCSENSILV